jgi:hypothetical protein
LYIGRLLPIDAVTPHTTAPSRVQLRAIKVKIETNFLPAKLVFNNRICFSTNRGQFFRIKKIPIKPISIKINNKPNVRWKLKAFENTTSPIKVNKRRKNISIALSTTTECVEISGFIFFSLQDKTPILTISPTLIGVI